MRDKLALQAVRLIQGRPVFGLAVPCLAVFSATEWNGPQRRI